MSDSQRAARARARKHWPVRRFAAGQEPPDELVKTSTPAERIGMMWQLACDAWAVAGRPIPNYNRSATTSRLFRPGQPRASD